MISVIRFWLIALNKAHLQEEITSKKNNLAPYFCFGRWKHVHALLGLLSGMRCDGLWLAAALLLCRAIPQVQPVLQSLRRPCSHLPRPDAACSAFSTSRAERGPTPQHYCRDSHTHTKTHTPTQGLSTRAVGHHTDSLFSAQAPSSLLRFSLFFFCSCCFFAHCFYHLTLIWTITWVIMPLRSTYAFHYSVKWTLVIIGYPVIAAGFCSMRRHLFKDIADCDNTFSLAIC